MYHDLGLRHHQKQAREQDQGEWRLKPPTPTCGRMMRVEIDIEQGRPRGRRHSAKLRHGPLEKYVLQTWSNLAKSMLRDITPISYTPWRTELG